jgi:2-phosphosulfolactate phosphatase
MKISVYHTPEETPDHNIADCAIAIDVLRATTTIATALSVGAEAVQVFSDLNVLNQESDLWPEAKRLRAGERGGNKVEGFDLGNSPLDCTLDLMRDKRLFISTTNGTRALQKIQDSPAVLAAALVNRRSVVDYLLKHQPETVWIVGAGWEGSYALEDTVCAGAIAQEIIDRTHCKLTDLAGNDELVAAVALFNSWKDDLVGLMHHASHGQRLVRLSIIEDIGYCAALDTVDTLPIQREIGVLVRHSVQ